MPILSLSGEAHAKFEIREIFECSQERLPASGELRSAYQNSSRGSGNPRKVFQFRSLFHSVLYIGDILWNTVIYSGDFMGSIAICRRIGHVQNMPDIQGYHGLTRGFPSNGWIPGVGIAAAVMAFWLNIYYIVVLSWAMCYLVASLRVDEDVPWRTCNNSYDSPLGLFWISQFF